MAVPDSLAKPFDAAAWELLEECSDGIVEAGPDLLVRRVNRAAEQILGQPRRQLDGRPLAEIFPNRLLAPFASCFADVAAGGTAYHFRRDVPGSTDCIDGRLVRTPSGVALFMRNIGDRQRLERELADEMERRRRVEERFETALSVNPLVVFNLDRELHYTWVYNNQVAARDHDTPGTTPADYFDDETVGSLVGLFRSVLDQGISVRAELRLRPKVSRQERHFITSVKPMYGKDGGISGLTGASIDITDIVHQRQELAKAKEEAMTAKAEAERASAAKSKFLAAASHDLRQPVQSLMLLITVLKRRLAGSPTDTVVEFMDQALEALHMLLDSLLDISKLDAGIVVANRENVGLNELFARLAGEYRIRAQEQGVELRVVPTSLRTFSDPALLERVLRNLIENAIRYSPSGRILLGCRRRGTLLASIDVVDTGIGIAPSHISSIFDEFYQVHNEARDRAQGLGLGLAIVQRIVKLLDAGIEVASKPGRGSRFSVLVPVIAPDGVLRHAIGTQPAGQGQRILIIEDDEILRSSFEMMLAEGGHAPRAVRSGEEAIVLVGAGYRPDALIADYRLAGGLTGADAVTRIRQTLGQTIPAMIITGDVSPAPASGGPWRCLRKPVSAQAFSEVLAAMLAEAAPITLRPASEPAGSE